MIIREAYADSIEVLTRLIHTCRARVGIYQYAPDVTADTIDLGTDCDLLFNHTITIEMFTHWVPPWHIWIMLKDYFRTAEESISRMEQRFCDCVLEETLPGEERDQELKDIRRRMQEERAAILAEWNIDPNGRANPLLLDEYAYFSASFMCPREVLSSHERTQVFLANLLVAMSSSWTNVVERADAHLKNLRLSYAYESDWVFWGPEDASSHARSCLLWDLYAAGVPFVFFCDQLDTDGDDWHYAFDMDFIIALAQSDVVQTLFPDLDWDPDISPASLGKFFRWSSEWNILAPLAIALDKLQQSQPPTWDRILFMDDVSGMAACADRLATMPELVADAERLRTATQYKEREAIEHAIRQRAIAAGIWIVPHKDWIIWKP